MTEAWSEWVGHVVNGGFCLQKYLGGSDQSGVFLTEHAGRGLLQAAIKLVPADAHAELRLSQWRRAQNLSHDHLIRIFDLGRCQRGGNEFLFVVMEYAEENLSQIVPERPLTAAEAREMLGPALDALTYLHSQGLVHGCLKPANILAIKDQLKLASDCICAAGESTTNTGKHSLYDPPERARAGASPAGDIWSLGITLAEVLTQHVPSWNEHDQVDPVLPEGLPAPFSDIVRGCLYRYPARRWTVAEIGARLRPPSSSVSSPRPAPVMPAVLVPAPTTPPPATAPLAAEASLPARRRFPVLPLVLIAVAIVLFVWRALTRNQGGQSLPKTSSPQQGSGVIQPVPAPGNKPSPVKTQSGARPATSNRVPAENDVVHQVLPDVPQAARDTIQGTIRVAVRVQVDRFGSVVGAAFDSQGPSQYFARLAFQAAQNWKFAPGSQDAVRAFILRFQFTNTATRASAVRTP